MGYCFMTIEKIKNFNQMAGKYKHNYRKIDVLNADPDRANLNEELVSLDGLTYREAFEKRVNEFGYGVDKKIRSNAVYAFEIVTTFSREDKEHVDIERWKKDNVDWLKKEFNANPEHGENILSVIYHGDEAGNVHCHAIVVPIDDKGNLNARHYLRSRQKLIELQDSYGLAMKSHGLERGIKNSKARHQDIKRYYASLNATLHKELPMPKMDETIESYQKRVQVLFEDANLKAMALKDKYERLSISTKQQIKNELSAAKKAFFEENQHKVDSFDELEREYGTIYEVKEKCDTYDCLLEGIAVQDDKEPIIDLVNQLITAGKFERQRSKDLEK